MVTNKELALTIGRTGQVTLDRCQATSLMAVENTYGKMAVSMKGNGSKKRCMAMVLSLGEVESSTVVNILTINNMVLVRLLMLMVIPLKEFGRMGIWYQRQSSTNPQIKVI